MLAPGDGVEGLVFQQFPVTGPVTGVVSPDGEQIEEADLDVLLARLPGDRGLASPQAVPAQAGTAYLEVSNLET